MMASEQLFYFDENGLLRRIDYAPIHAANGLIEQYAWAHQAFSGIAVPTLQRAAIASSGQLSGRSTPIVDIEVFDIQFE